MTTIPVDQSHNWLAILLANMVERACVFLDKSPYCLTDYVETEVDYNGTKMKIRIEFSRDDKRVVK